MGSSTLGELGRSSVDCNRLPLATIWESSWMGPQSNPPPMDYGSSSPSPAVCCRPDRTAVPVCWKSYCMRPRGGSHGKKGSPEYRIGSMQRVSDRFQTRSPGYSGFGTAGLTSYLVQAGIAVLPNRPLSLSNVGSCSISYTKYAGVKSPYFVGVLSCTDGNVVCLSLRPLQILMVPINLESRSLRCLTHPPHIQL